MESKRGFWKSEKIDDIVNVMSFGVVKLLLESLGILYGEMTSLIVLLCGGSIAGNWSGSRV